MKLVWTKDQKKGGLKNARFDWGQVESACYKGTTLQAVRITREPGKDGYIIFIYDWSSSPIKPSQIRVAGRFVNLRAAKTEAQNTVLCNKVYWPICLRNKP